MNSTENLRKSMEELEAATADLEKSMKKSDDTQDDVKPEDIVEHPESVTSDNTDDEAEKESAATAGESDPAENDETVKKSCGDVEKCDPNGDIIKSEDGGDDDGDDDEPSEAEHQEIVKSVLTQDPDVDALIQHSGFAAGLVTELCKALGSVSYAVGQSRRSGDASDSLIMKSVAAVMRAQAQVTDQVAAENRMLRRQMNSMQKSMESGFQDLQNMLEQFGQQPAHMRKSMSSVHAHERNFQASLNGGAVAPSAETLSKSAVLGVLQNELFNGNPHVTAEAIVGYESGAPLTPELLALVNNKIRQG